MSSDQQPSSESQASMLGGHVKYVQGAISSAVGYESGQQTKAEAVQEMKDAKTQSEGQPAQSSLLGTVENAAGKVTGCEGMVDEGKKRIPEKRGVEEQSGTG
ncbi:uncharacterized protein Z520_00420 [Fonsecaea multimorphosa CBS 102226]|uniref:CsbD-like domain-containing protein n=1 Tax=Fonsecaea multimorphosa CBS 102226 TaxID=1442371 RepID=A0A0D2L3U2_9EURO|nr:uncharacterized protein Z520_00420 [Fonsecaea multimorphosa CBS 102226]KIY03729.1 hypothetical protein Z520_00420 [Fonsecaea multimorphosa CBS 102226]OAL32426.1 hypothetical protein AYO22_00448 [Fonsecaea multimorphosa]